MEFTASVHIFTLIAIVDYDVAKNYKSIGNNRNVWKYMVFMHWA